MNALISGKRNSMEEIHVRYTDENGEERTSVHFVDPEIINYISAMMNDIEDLEDQVEYWKRMLNVHITSGIRVN